MRKSRVVVDVAMAADSVGVEKESGAPKSAPALVAESLEEDPPGTVAYEIRTTTDAVNELLESAERALVNLNLGIEGEVALDEYTTLAFRKTRSGWKIFVDTTEGFPETRIVSRELLSVPRELRIVAAARLDDLLTVLLNESSGRLKMLREAVDDLERFHARIAEESK